MQPFHIVIPARYASSRFPGKPLQPLNGKAMLLHVVDRAHESDASVVIVATDDERIAQLCKEHGVEVQMTSVEHTSGTDRIAEVAKRLGWVDDVVIVGLQGDEPATPADHLNRLAANLREHTDADMATLCLPITSRADYDNPDRVKVVRDARGMALYFSRASIPRRRGAGRDASDDAGENTGFPSAFVHVGLYAYRCAYLQRYSALTPSDAEQEEQLEQLRVLHHGGRIHVDEVVAAPAHGVDRPEDVKAIERLLASFDF